MQLKKWSNGVEIREVGLGNKHKNECVHIFLHEGRGVHGRMGGGREEIRLSFSHAFERMWNLIE